MFDLPQVPAHVLPIAFFVLASGGCSPQALPTRLSCGCHQMNKTNNCHKFCFVLSIWVFYHQDGQSLAHVAQRGCGVSISGDNSTQLWANCSGWPPTAMGLEQWPPEVCSNLHHSVVLMVHRWEGSRPRWCQWTQLSQTSMGKRPVGPFRPKWRLHWGDPAGWDKLWENWTELGVKAPSPFSCVFGLQCSHLRVPGCTWDTVSTGNTMAQ